MRNTDVLEFTGLMVQLILLMMLDEGILGMSEGRAVKKPSNYVMTAQNALRTWTCLLFATQTHLVHPMLECWDIAHPVSVESSCWSFSCLWAPITIPCWPQTEDMKNFL